jgi:hypothetical protein
MGLSRSTPKPTIDSGTFLTVMRKAVSTVVWSPQMGQAAASA